MPEERVAVQPVDLLVTGCGVLVDDGGPLGAGIRVLEDAAVAVTAGRVVAVGPAADLEPLRATAAEVLPARGLMAVPGLVNCHTHAAMVLFRGMAEDVPVQRWFDERIWPVEVNLTERDVELGALLACAEMALGGTTAFADHYFHVDAVARAVTASGLRADLGWAHFGSEGPHGRDGLARGLDAALRLAGAADGRITTSLAPHAPYTVDEEGLAATARAAAEHGLRVHLHAAETPEQTRASLERAGATPVGVLARTGLLDVDVLLAHGTGIGDAGGPGGREGPAAGDAALLAEARGRVAVATSPRFYLKAAHATTPTRLLAGAGVPVGVATDGAASNGDLDLWTTLELLSLTAKAAEGDPTWMTSRQVLHHATAQSAAAYDPSGALGLGRLAPGSAGDLALLDTSAPHLRPVHDAAATLVHAARAADVVHTVVAGRVVVRDRRLLTVDVPAVLAELEPRLAALVRRGPGRVARYEL